VLAKGGLLILLLRIRIEGVGRRGDVDDIILILPIGESLYAEVDVDDGEEDEELDDAVGTTEHEYDTGVIAI